MHLSTFPPPLCIRAASAQVSTLMVAVTRAFATQLQEGKPVVGGDLRMQIMPLRTVSL